MALYQKIDLGLQDAVGDIGSGLLQLPEFQRDFRWRPSEQVSLLASIQRNFPVGSVLLLEVSQTGEIPFAIRPFSGAEPETDVRPRYLVLDGQQRLTTCFRALSNVGSKRAVIDLVGLFQATQALPHPSTLNFEEFIRFERATNHLDQLLMNKNCLPFGHISDRQSLRQNLRVYRDGLLENPATRPLGEFVDSDLESFLDIFFEYQFPAVVLPADLEAEAIANVFTKINTTGLRLSAFDLCVASLFPSNIGLRTMWNAAVEDNKISRFGDDGTETLQAVALTAGVNSRKASLFSVLKSHHVLSDWNPVIDAFKSLSETLELVGVSNSKTLPYSGALPLLIAATAKVPVSPLPPAKALRQSQLANYLLHTALSLRYTEGLDSKREEDFREMVSYLSTQTAPAFMSTPVFWDDAEVIRLGRNGARSTAVMMMLNREHPCDLINHDQRTGLDLTGYTQAEIHHIFPRAYLASINRASEADRALNFTLLTPDSNNFISDRPPSVYIGEILALIAQQKNCDLTQARAELLLVLKSHFLDEACLDALLTDSYDEFLVARSRHLRVKVESMGISTVSAGTTDLSMVDEDEEIE